MTLHRREALTRSLLVVAAVALTVGVSACAPDGGADPAPTGPVPSNSGAASATPEASTPTFDPSGDAEANLPIFTETVEKVWAGEQRAQGRAYIDALVAAGFADKATMQLTPDQTTIGNAAESIQFSVFFADRCLIGQVGPATGEPRTEVAPALAEGRCLLGVTRPIDW